MSIEKYFTWFLSRLLSKSIYDKDFFHKKLLSEFFEFLYEKIGVNSLFILIYKEHKSYYSYLHSENRNRGSILGVYESLLEKYQLRNFFIKKEKSFFCLKKSEINKPFSTKDGDHLFKYIFELLNAECIDIMPIYYTDFEIYFGFSFSNSKNGSKKKFLKKQDVLIDIFITLSYFFVFLEERDERRDLLKILSADINELKNFSAILAHEIKRPLGNIRTKIDIFKDEIKKKNSSADIRKYFDFVDDKLEYLNRLINSMLNYSVYYFSDHQTIDQVNLNKLLQNISVDLDIEKRNIQMIILSDLPIIWIDPVAIRQVFENIIENSVKNIDPQKKEHCIWIDYKLNKHRHKHIFSIRDNGVGIRGILISRIFDLFEKSEYQSDKNFSMGIGLAIVKRILDVYSGLIWAESNAEKGTTFFFELPV